MFPPVLTTEGVRGRAARPGSRDDPTRGIPVAPRNFARKGLLARAWPIPPGRRLRRIRVLQNQDRVAHRSRKSKLSVCPVGMKRSGRRPEQSGGGGEGKLRGWSLCRSS